MICLPGRWVYATLIPRIREHTHAIPNFWSVATVAAASVAHKYSLLLHGMTALSVHCTRIDGVLVVEAPAH